MGLGVISLVISEKITLFIQQQSYIDYQILTLWVISTQLSIIKTQNNYKSQFHGNGAANFYMIASFL